MLGVVVQRGHGCSEAAQVHGAWRVLVNAAVLPVQHRHHPGLVAGGGEPRRRTVAGAQRFGNGQVGVGVEGGQPGQFALDGQCRVGITPVPLRTVHAQQKAAGGESCRKVVFSSWSTKVSVPEGRS